MIFCKCSKAFWYILDLSHYRFLVMAKGNKLIHIYFPMLCFTHPARLLCAGGAEGQVPRTVTLHIRSVSGIIRSSLAELLNWYWNLASHWLSSYLRGVWWTCVINVLGLSGDTGNLIWQDKLFFRNKLEVSYSTSVFNLFFILVLWLAWKQGWGCLRRNPLGSWNGGIWCRAFFTVNHIIS